MPLFAMAAIGSFLCGGALTYAFSSYLNSSKPAQAAEGAQATASTSQVASRSLFGSGNATDISQVNFFTDLLKALWPELDVAVSKMIRASCEEIFATLTPKIKVQKMQLGNVPMRMENIQVLRQTKNQSSSSIRLTMDVVWNGNCDMEFTTNLGVGFGVEHLKFHGRLVCTLFPLTQELPLIGAVQYAFINPPKMQMKFTGLASIANTSILQDTVQSTMASSLTSLVLPNQSLYKMDPKLTLEQIYQAPLGIVRLTILSGSGFQEEVRRMAKNDIPDVFVKVQFGAGGTYQTAVVKNSLKPIWKQETCDFMLYDKDQLLRLEAWDEDNGTLDADDALGSTHVSIQEVLQGMRNGIHNLSLQTDDYRPTGSSLQIACEILPLLEDPSRIVMTPTKKSSHLQGLLTVLIPGVQNLPTTVDKASSYVKVKVGDLPEKVTATVIDYPGLDALNPFYDATMEYPLTSEVIGKDIALEVWNGATPKELKLTGSTSIAWKSIVASPKGTLTLTQQSIQGECTMGVTVMLHSVAEPLPKDETKVPSLMDEAAATTDVETPMTSSVGTTTEVLTITAISGRGFPVERKRLKKADIPDVYLQLTVGTSPKVWRTPTCKNKENPTWKVSHDFTLASSAASNQTITIQSFDEDKGKWDGDDPMGQGRVNVGHILTSPGSTLEVELHDETNGQPLGRYVTLACQIRTV